jgi:hypothetical protein
MRQNRGRFLYRGMTRALSPSPALVLILIQTFLPINWLPVCLCQRSAARPRQENTRWDASVAHLYALIAEREDVFSAVTVVN